MCIFSAPVTVVAGTCIVVGETNNDKVRIVYSNKVACDNNNIMILPVDANNVELVELPKDYESFGDDLANEYQQYHDYLYPKQAMKNMTNSYDTNNVEIIKYGPYDVSLTKSLNNVNWNHFGGLNNKKKFYDLMTKKYPDHLFLIAKMRSNLNKTEPKIPICYDYKPKNDNNIMLPTFHIHDGKQESDPSWDHHIVVINGHFNTKINELHIDKAKSEYFFKSVMKLVNQNINNDSYKRNY